MERLKRIPHGALPAVLFVILAAITFVFHMANTDVTGSGLAFFLMTMPWGWLLPDAVTASEYWNTVVYPLSWLMILANAALIACVCTWFARRGNNSREQR